MTLSCPKIALFLLLLLSASVSNSVLAHADRLRHSPFEFYSEGESLKNVLTALATNAGAGIAVSDSVNDTFNGHINKPSSIEALDFLANAYDLIWYFDGSTLFVNKSNELQNQMLRLNLISADQVKRTLKRLKLWDHRFDWRAMDSAGILMISGPPRYIEVVSKTISFLQVGSDPESNDTLQVKIFKLKHASAIDREFTVRGKEVVLPGVATILGNLIGSGQNSDPNSLVSLDSDEKSEDQEAPIMRARGAAHPLARVQVDPSLNSVIVQDYRSRIRLYADLIEQLDQPKEQLEISLVIIDLSTNSLEELGIDWAVKNTRRGGGLFDLVLPGANDDVQDRIDGTNVDFLATVSALESKGQARVTSRPAVVTENGMQALLDSNETFFVRVQGERVAELEAITYGTLLQVTPRIVTGDKPRHIYLDVNIEDGNRLQDSGLESLPTIKNTQISTRASVPEGASLLIGGYYRESRTRNRDAIPLLGDIPLIGGLFTHQGHNDTQMVRLFMISPKIIALNHYKPGHIEDMSQPFSFSKQLGDLASLSHQVDRIQQLTHMLPCESARDARTRRNRYIGNNYQTRIAFCRDIDGEEGFRVSLVACPPGGVEPECR